MSCWESVSPKALSHPEIHLGMLKNSSHVSKQRLCSQPDKYLGSVILKLDDMVKDSLGGPPLSIRDGGEKVAKEIYLYSMSVNRILMPGWELGTESYSKGYHHYPISFMKRWRQWG